MMRTVATTTFQQNWNLYRTNFMSLKINLKFKSYISIFKIDEIWDFYLRCNSYIFHIKIYKFEIDLFLKERSKNLFGTDSSLVIHRSFIQHIAKMFNVEVKLYQHLIFYICIIVSFWHCFRLDSVLSLLNFSALFWSFRFCRLSFMTNVLFLLDIEWIIFLRIIVN